MVSHDRTEDQERSDETTAAVVEVGAKARLTRGVSGFEEGKAYPAGFEFTVDEYIGADVSEDGVAFYWGSANGGSYNVAMPADAVEMVMSRESMDSRKLPTVDEFSSALGSELCGMYEDDYDTDESNYEGDGLTLVHGVTREGLSFVAEVFVRRIYETDF